MRVTMYVMNDVRHDTRVLREARTLVMAGHAVTVVGATARGEPSGMREKRDGFEIIRVAIPRRWPLWFTWLRHPWRLASRVRREVTGGLRAGPRGWLRAIVALTAAVVSLPWVAIRGIWVALDRSGEKPEHRQTFADYLLWWRVSVGGWSKAAVIVAPPADVHHANDIETLATALEAAKRDDARTVYDSHEVSMERGLHARQTRWVRSLSSRRERRLARRCDGIITVNQACAAELARRFGVTGIVVVHNCPPRWDPPAPTADRVRRALDLDPAARIVLCHGGLGAGRGLELTIEAMAHLPDVPAHLVFMGYGPSVERYRDLADQAGLGDRFHLLDAVDPEAVLEWVTGVDVDVMVIQPTELNTILSTPNKLFESLAAGVPVVSSDFPSRRGIIIDDPNGPLGAVCDPTDPGAIADAIRRVLELEPGARADLRARCLRAAHERWNWETESAKLIALYANLAERRRRSSTGAAG